MSQVSPGGAHREEVSVLVDRLFYWWTKRRGGPVDEQVGSKR